MSELRKVLGPHKLGSATDLVKEGDYMLKHGGMVLRLRCRKPRTIEYEQWGEGNGEFEGKILDWIQRAVMEVRGF